MTLRAPGAAAWPISLWLLVIVLSLAPCCPARATGGGTVLVIAPSCAPPEALVSDELGSQMAAELRRYTGLTSGVLNPADPALKRALKSKSIMAQEIRDPASFGAAVHLAAICGADYVLFGAFAPASASDPGPVHPTRVHLMLGYVFSGSVSPMEVPEVSDYEDGSGGMASGTPAPTTQAPAGFDNAPSERPRRGEHDSHHESKPSPSAPAALIPIPAWVARYARAAAAAVAQRLGAPKAIPIEPVTSSTGPEHFANARRLIDSGQSAAAVKELGIAIAASPDNGTYKATLATLLLGQGHAASAAALFQDAATLSPFDAEIRSGLGSALQAGGDTTGALEAYREAETLAPESSEIHARMGKLLMLQGNSNDGLTELALAARGKDAASSDSLADALMASQDWDRAETMLRNNIKAAPARLYPRSRLATLMLRRGKMGAAVEVWTEALQAGVAPASDDLPGLFLAVNREIGSAVDALNTPPVDNDAARGRVQAVSALLDALKVESPDWKKRRGETSTAASEVLQAIAELKADAPGAPTAGDAAMLLNHARQLISVGAGLSSAPDKPMPDAGLVAGRIEACTKVKLELFDYHLPAAAIAQSAVEPRDSSRLLVVHRSTGELEHRRFSDVLDYLSAGDVLVVNNTRVRHARVTAYKPTGGRVEILVLEILGDDRLKCLVRPGRRSIPGGELIFEDGRRAAILERTPEGGRLLELEPGLVASDWLEQVGAAPLPPYIHTTLQDPSRYQTVYNRTAGSAAAPTAGLHFTDELLQRARNLGVEVVEITLHVGIDTFRPVKTPDIESHEMHSEWYTVPEEAAAKINAARGRIVAVGTTSVRTLESAAAGLHRVNAGSASTRLYITPGYEFRCVDLLITNFHVPRSSLLILVSSFAGRDLILRAYEEAEQLGYRFLSFGDAMLIL